MWWDSHINPNRLQNNFAQVIFQLHQSDSRSLSNMLTPECSTCALHPLDKVCLTDIFWLTGISSLHIFTQLFPSWLITVKHNIVNVIGWCRWQTDVSDVGSSIGLDLALFFYLHAHCWLTLGLALGDLIITCTWGYTLYITGGPGTTLGFLRWTKFNYVCIWVSASLVPNLFVGTTNSIYLAPMPANRHMHYR